MVKPHRFSLSRKVVEGERLPFGYGIAWMEFASYTGVALPIPLNLIVRAGRTIYFRLIQYRVTDWERREAEAYRRGVAHGIAKEKADLQARVTKFFEDERRERRRRADGIR